MTSLDWMDRVKDILGNGNSLIKTEKWPVLLEEDWEWMVFFLYKCLAIKVIIETIKLQ